MEKEDEGKQQQQQCESVINVLKDRCWRPAMSNTPLGDNMPRLCWDHGCRNCGNWKQMWKFPLCSACQKKGVQIPDVPEEIRKDLFACDLTLAAPGLTVVNAYEKLVGSCVLYTAMFHPRSGHARSIPFFEMKDHIFFSPDGFSVQRAAPPPALDAIRGGGAFTDLALRPPLSMRRFRF